MGGTALGLGRGDEVYPLLRQVQAHVVVVDPGRPLSTAAVFRRLDQRLTPRENANNIFRFVSSQLDGQGDAFPGLSNDLERAALEEDPGLEVLGRRYPGYSGPGGGAFRVPLGERGGVFRGFPRCGRARSGPGRRWWRAASAPFAGGPSPWIGIAGC